MLTYFRANARSYNQTHETVRVRMTSAFSVFVDFDYAMAIRSVS